MVASFQPRVCRQAATFHSRRYHAHVFGFRRDAIFAAHPPNAPKLHRALGRLAAAGAVLGGLSGVWMTIAHSEISTPLLFAGRLIFGSAMAAFAVFAIRDAMHRNFLSHRNWIIRSYAIAFNAASMPLLCLPIILIIGQPVPIIDDAFRVTGWIINLVIAERFFITTSPLRPP